jgi:hypothetical protein
MKKVRKETARRQNQQQQHRMCELMAFCDIFVVQNNYEKILILKNNMLKFPYS